jgi:uncharacterized membrane-anchored protein YitT (DUF2179 family)
VIFFQYFIRFLKLYESIGEYKMREKIENFIAMSGATLLIAVGTYFFKFPNNFTFGGITGLAVLIAKTGLISAADFSFVANMSLLILGAVKNSLQRQPTAVSCFLLRFLYLNESFQ